MPLSLAVIVLLTILGLGAPLQTQEAGAEASPYVEKSRREINFYPGGKVDLTLALPGHVTITGWERSTIVVEIEKLVRRLPEDQAKALAAQHPVRVRHTQTITTITVNAPPKPPENIEVNLTLLVPKQRTDLKLQIAKGNLAVSNLTGWIDATLAEGSMRMSSISGYFAGITKLGDVEVDLTGKRWEGYGVTVATNRGSVLLRVPSEYSAALQLETREGDLSIDYPEQLVEGESVPSQPLHSKRASHSRPQSATADHQ